MSIHGGGSDRLHRSNSEGDADWVDHDVTATTSRSRPTLTRRLHSVPNYTDTEMENALNAFFHEEATSLKTNTRLIVENFFSKVCSNFRTLSTARVLMYDTIFVALTI
jgi:hypothetical protein